MDASSPGKLRKKPEKVVLIVLVGAANASVSIEPLGSAGTPEIDDVGGSLERLLVSGADQAIG